MQGAIQMVRYNEALKKIDFGAFPYDIIQKDMEESSLRQPNIPLY